MRRRFVFASSVLTFIALIALPGSTLAAAGYDYGIVHDYCGGTYGWTSYFKAKIISSDTAGANKLTIDSKVQASDPGHPRWYTAQTWPRVSTTFTPNGTFHHLTLARHATGGVDVRVRIVFKMQAWDHGLLAWSTTIKSTAC